jgi:group I intron endonuclease
MNSGVYIIENIGTSDSYIGSTKNLEKRFKDHLYRLRVNTHPNKNLQCGWDKFGDCYFQIRILEYCSEDKLLEREQYYMDLLNPTYNIAKEAGTVSGIHWDDELRTKLMPFVEQLIARKRKVWPGFISPDGEEFLDIPDLRIFCEEYGLNRKHMAEVSTGKRTSHKGWHCIGYTPGEKPHIDGEVVRFYKITTNTGVVFDKLTNLKYFCKSNGIKYSAMQAIYLNRNKSHYGIYKDWQCETWYEVWNEGVGI